MLKTKGWKLAAFVVGISAVGTAVIVGMILLLITWFGVLGGGIASIVIVLIAMFLVIGLTTRNS